MAKKISKRSRAARRGYLEETGEAKDLATIPKVNDDVKSSIIRTTIKNENLLEKIMERKSATKVAKKKTSTSRSKLERSDKLAGVLGTKIEQSIARARFVQNARKAGWDQINKTINLKEGEDEKPTSKQLEKQEEDEYVKQFFDEVNEDKKNEPKVINKFSLLEEAEA